MVSLLHTVLFLRFCCSEILYVLIIVFNCFCSVVGYVVTVAPELLVQVCRHDGMPITLYVTHVTSSATRASHVLYAGERIVLLLTGKWSSVGTVASRL